MSRREDDVLAGVIRIPFEGGDRLVPTLKIKSAREWKAKAMEAAQSLFAFDGSLEALPKVANLATDTMVDLVAAYDQQNVLGGKEALEDALDDAQAWAVLKQMLEVVFPFAQDLATLIRALGLDLAPNLPKALGGSVAESAEPNNTNGRSPSGASKVPARSRKP